MAFTGRSSDTKTSEHLGAFSGYVRRPIPNQSGMIAQIFGENGDDADTILALSLSKFQDVEVLVNVYLVKDSVGRIMKEGDNYRVISSFVGRVRRSLPKIDGMIAQFYAPNGEHADSVSLLSKSEYQDCLVFVDVRGSLAANENQDDMLSENIEAIEEKCSGKITKQQRMEMVRKEKHFKKMNERLQFSEFLYRVEVLMALGNPEEFKKWLSDERLCSHSQESPCKSFGGAVQVKQFFKPFNFLPTCETHRSHFEDDSHFEENRTYYEMKHRLLTKEWVWERMKAKFSFDGSGEPDPSKVIDWATTANVKKFLPPKYDVVL